MNANSWAQEQFHRIRYLLKPDESYIVELSPAQCDDGMDSKFNDSLDSHLCTDDLSHLSSATKLNLYAADENMNPTELLYIWNNIRMDQLPLFASAIVDCMRQNHYNVIVH